MTIWIGFVVALLGLSACGDDSPAVSLDDDAAEIPCAHGRPFPHASGESSSHPEAG